MNCRVVLSGARVHRCRGSVSVLILLMEMHDFVRSNRSDALTSHVNRLQILHHAYGEQLDCICHAHTAELESAFATSATALFNKFYGEVYEHLGNLLLIKDRPQQSEAARLLHQHPGTSFCHTTFDQTSSSIVLLPPVAIPEAQEGLPMIEQRPTRTEQTNMSPEVPLPPVPATKQPLDSQVPHGNSSASSTAGSVHDPSTL